MEKITVYGSNVCPGTLRFLSILTEHHYMPVFINVTGSINLLKEFILLRDTEACFEGMHGSGSIGFPLIKMPDGTFTRDYKAVLEFLGIDEDFSFN
ncbi:MAG: hypothetical protein IIY52_05710 [Solobacterium sp.]|nr:glutaredoxin [Erysipelotrichaceae bacterium]MBQ1325497.1 hypothetical protein [Solobacterium sp.]MBQ1383438.1 hypothetical protein [Solobacterium sp.]MBQ1445832.1 hypothetical protein [Solobacterium sp.]MBR0477652.1 hypothetical protein [Solobacterium sp.]